MKIITSIAAAAIALAATAGSASAQATPVKTQQKPVIHRAKKTETEADLMKEAKISKDSATAIALARVPGATVKSAELERENGKLIWSFDLTSPGKTGIDEVHVNAITGKVVGKTKHESPKTEKKEAKKDTKTEPRKDTKTETKKETKTEPKAKK